MTFILRKETYICSQRVLSVVPHVEYTESTTEWTTAVSGWRSYGMEETFCCITIICLFISDTCVVRNRTKYAIFASHTVTDNVKRNSIICDIL